MGGNTVIEGVNDEDHMMETQETFDLLGILPLVTEQKPVRAVKCNGSIIGETTLGRRHFP